MKAMLCRDYGPPESLQLAELPDPTPGPGEVAVAVRSAAVYFPDVLFMSGGYQVLVPPPFSPGSEFAGEALAVGEGVALRTGDRVSGSVMVGAFAEQVVVPEKSLSPIPVGERVGEGVGEGLLLEVCGLHGSAGRDVSRGRGSPSPSTPRRLPGQHRRGRRAGSRRAE